MAFSYMLPNFYGNALSTATTPAPPSTSGSGNVTATSTGTTGIGGLAPDMSLADPSIVSAFNNLGLVYSASAGGYIPGAQASNANSYYNKFGRGGGGDPMSNLAASNYYNYLGSLPTRSYGSMALAKLYQQTGQQAPRGPSFNSILQGYQSQIPSQYQNMLPMNQGGWTGPYSMGQ